MNDLSVVLRLYTPSEAYRSGFFLCLMEGEECINTPGFFFFDFAAFEDALRILSARFDAP